MSTKQKMDIDFIFSVLEEVEVRKPSTAAPMKESCVKLESRACDECRRMHKKCSKNIPSCDRCLARGRKCCYTPKKKKGRPRLWQYDEAKGKCISLNSHLSEKVEKKKKMKKMNIENAKMLTTAQVLTQLPNLCENSRTMKNEIFSTFQENEMQKPISENEIPRRRILSVEALLN